MSGDSDYSQAIKVIVLGGRVLGMALAKLFTNKVCAELTGFGRALFGREISQARKTKL